MEPGFDLCDLSGVIKESKDESNMGDDSGGYNEGSYIGFGKDGIMNI